MSAPAMAFAAYCYVGLGIASACFIDCFKRPIRLAIVWPLMAIIGLIWLVRDIGRLLWIELKGAVR